MLPVSAIKCVCLWTLCSRSQRNANTRSPCGHIWRSGETSLDLYGFLEQPELEFFEMLITISGIGPKSALGILSVAPIDTIKHAIASGDTSYLTKVSGIGKKNAEKIVVELRDRLGGAYSSAGTMLKEDADVIAALQSIGYSLKEARDALKGVSKDTTGTNEKIREALKQLGGSVK